MMSETFEQDIHAQKVKQSAHKRKAEAPRMIITMHVVPRKEKKSRKTKTSKKRRAEPVHSDESDDADDKHGSTRAFSPNGFLMVFCSVGLDTTVTASDSVKTKVIGFIEAHREMKVTTRSSWDQLDKKEKSSLLRNFESESFMEQGLQHLEIELCRPAVRTLPAAAQPCSVPSVCICAGLTWAQ